MRPRLSLLAALGILAIGAGCATDGSRQNSQLRVRTDFPGGSAQVEQLSEESKTIQLTPTLHPGRGWDAWWYFKLEGVKPGETITLDVGKGIWATPDQAMFSYDNVTWQHTSPGKRQKDRIVYQHTVEKTPVWFAWGPPFVLSDAERLIDNICARSPYATRFVLAKSKDGHTIPALKLYDPSVPASEKLGIWVEARQHAWESGSSWVGKGFIEWVISDDPQAKALRQMADIYFVPIMDVDNVQRGAGGKNATPHDQNRDWSDSPHYPEVAAAQEHIRELNRIGRFDLFVDLHNPAPNDKRPFYFVTVAEYLSAQGAKNLKDFFLCSKEAINGPLPLLDKARESGPEYDKAWDKISKNWVTKHTAGHVVAITLETSWNTPQSTQEGYQTVGRQLGEAIAKYFTEPRR